MKQYKISFCTVCMNRLHHVQQTLLKNIEDNSGYSNVEFILLDYNSKDGTEDWVKSELSAYIANGTLVYYKTNTPQYFDRSHSRNLMFKLATGDIICNIDADNFTGNGFAAYINQSFNENESIVLLADTKRRHYFIRDCIGRFCAKKEDFLAISGYDESMKGYGLEDDDLYERLLKDREEKLIMDFNFLKAIKHDDEERTKNEFYTTNIHAFYIAYQTPEQSEVLFLYKDNMYNRGLILSDNTSFVTIKIDGHIWEKGSWEEGSEKLILNTNAGFDVFTKQENSVIEKSTEQIFYKIDDKAFLRSLELQLPLITNKGKYLFNKENKKYVVNQNGFGTGKVIKNFSEMVEVL